MLTYRTTRRVQFDDTDMSGCAHFTRILALAESAEHEFFLKSIGNFFLTQAGVGLPRLTVQCSYKAPLIFGDEISVVIRFTRASTATIAYEFEVRRDEVIAAEGKIVIGCCLRTDSRSLQPMPMPVELIEIISEAQHV